METMHSKMFQAFVYGIATNSNENIWLWRLKKEVQITINRYDILTTLNYFRQKTVLQTRIFKMILFSSYIIHKYKNVW